MRTLFWAALLVLVFAAILMTMPWEQKHQPCNAEGDVRIIGTRKYVCERTPADGLRWKWKW